MYMGVNQQLGSYKAIISFITFEDDDNYYGELSSIQEDEMKFDDE